MADLVDLASQRPATSSTDGRLVGLLADLVSEPRLERVLAKIVDHARAAVQAADVVLMLDGERGLRCQPPCELAQETRSGLETWVGTTPELMTRPVLIEDASTVPALRPIGEATLRLRSVCAVPLRYGERQLGILVALGGRGAALGEVELATLEAYAIQAAIALTNASLFETQEALAKRDPLTGLLNHREFHETVALELANCRRTGAPMSVVLLDLDDFKVVNDTSGHGAGDRVLRSVASALAGACRAGDGAFRIGGDEFALVLPGTSADDGDEVARRAAKAVKLTATRIGASCGVASWPLDGPSKDALLAHADGALYEMKSRRQSGAAAAATGTRATPRQRLAVASRVATRLAYAQTAEEVARLTVEELHHSFDYYLAMVQRLDPDRVLRVVAGAGPLSDEMAQFLAMEQPIDEGVNGRVARTGEPAVVQDTQLDPDYLRRDPRADPGSELSLPIRVRGQIWGILNLEQEATHALSDDDLLLADTIAAQAGAAIHRCSLVDELENAFLTTLGVLSDAVEMKDAYTGVHAEEVADLATAVAGRLGMEGEPLRTVQYAALLHDVGKVGVRSELLTKQSALTDDEFEEMKAHSAIGARLLGRIPFLSEVVPLVRATHERWDGHGYPDGLVGPTIPVGARVIAVCDAYHAMTSDRPYRDALEPEEAILELEACAGTQFDTKVVAALLAELSR